MQGIETLRKKKVVFWDFDGVIKDSVEVKSDAFEKLFLPFGIEIASRVREHHEAHGGVSRYEKIPLYLDWVGEPKSPENVQTFCDRFARMVHQAVIEAPWVPGVPEYLNENCRRQHFVLLTATPHGEIVQIVDALGLTHCFHEIYGAPMSKNKAIGEVLIRYHYPPHDALMVGDSETDLNAALTNNVDFLLRRTILNIPLHERCQGASFEHL